MKPNVYYYELSLTMDIEFNDTISIWKIPQDALGKQKYQVTIGAKLGPKAQVVLNFPYHLIVIKNVSPIFYNNDIYF